MPKTTELLLDKHQLRSLCADLTSADLLRTRTALMDLIDERRAEEKERELSRKGERTLKDMRALMAKAGISMNEFQASLQGLSEKS